MVVLVSALEMLAAVLRKTETQSCYNRYDPRLSRSLDQWDTLAGIWIPTCTVASALGACWKFIARDEGHVS